MSHVVLLEIIFARKLERTLVTGVGLLSVVKPQVAGQVIALNERFVAFETHIWLFTGMDSLVRFEVGFVGESTSTELARKRFCTGMYSNMQIERGFCRIRLFAQTTTVRFLPCMRSDVPYQMSVL